MKTAPKKLPSGLNKITAKYITDWKGFDDFWNIKPLIEGLDLGYKFSIRKSAGNDICCDLILIAEVPAGKD